MSLYMCRQHKGGLKSFTIWSSRVSNVFVRDTRAADDSPLNYNPREDQETSADLEASTNPHNTTCMTD